MSQLQSSPDVVGSFQAPGHSAVYRARVSVHNERANVTVDLNPDMNRAMVSDYSFGPAIPGLPVEMHFSDGAIFIPEDPQFRWPDMKAHHTLLSRLESSGWVVAAAAMLTPLVVWWVVAVAMPAAAVRSVAIIPDSVPQEMGRETLIILDKWLVEPTALETASRQSLADRWNDALRRLSLSPDKFKLEFRSSESFGANAMALPDGTVILTDELVMRLQDNPDALVAVMLHEIGHVEHQHSLKMVAQSVATGLFFAVFFGDIEGAGELVIGAGSSLLQNAFSREMETEADHYAFDKLEQLDISPAAFADAMEAIVAEEGQQNKDGQQRTGQSDTSTWTDYLSTHPATAERIRAARKRAETFR